METRETNTDILPINPVSHPLRINDIGFRLILAPIFGITIPLVTGMIDVDNLSHWQVKLSFLYTILIAFIRWEGNRYLHFSLRSYFNWYNKPLRKIAVILISISFYTVPVSALLLSGWYALFDQGKPDREVITISTLMIMICVIFITHVYETVFLVKESENEMLRNAQLERAKAEAELKALKSQIDPHFIFNSLNTLSHLIEEKPATAKLFNDQLADVYRYILQHKRQELVLLREEMYFLNDYFSLLRMRFDNAVQLIIEVPEPEFVTYLIPPISLQLLVENAVKHNEFSKRIPLIVTIQWEEDHLIVSNKIYKKQLRNNSSKIGLNNLNERYKLTTGNAIRVNSTSDFFAVKLPLLKIV
ncbi:MAG TPA: histidine kinase [Agriterribacter sp.]|nr:histidine kinase [Agriterribacter sp.]